MKISGGLRLNFFLLLVIVTLAFVVTQEPGLNTQPVFNKISQLEEKNIQSIEIINSNQTNISFIKKNQAWYLKTDTGDIPADQQKMIYLFRLLNTDSLDSFPASKQQLEQYHLSSPRISVKFDALTIAFGNSEPLKHRRYTLINERVHLTSDRYYHFLFQSADTYLLAAQ